MQVFKVNELIVKLSLSLAIPEFSNCSLSLAFSCKWPSNCCAHRLLSICACALFSLIHTSTEGHILTYSFTQSQLEVYGKVWPKQSSAWFVPLNPTVWCSQGRRDHLDHWFHWQKDLQIVNQTHSISASQNDFLCLIFPDNPSSDPPLRRPLQSTSLGSLSITNTGMITTAQNRMMVLAATKC